MELTGPHPSSSSPWVLNISHPDGPSRNSLADEIGAIANTHDAVLVLGVDDRTKDIHKQVCLKISGVVVSNMKDIDKISDDLIADKVVNISKLIQKKAYGEKK